MRVVCPPFFVPTCDAFQQYPVEKKRELNHFDMMVADSDPDASAPPLPPPAENPRNSGSWSVTPLASLRRDLLGESDTESLSYGASTVSVDGVVVEVSELEVAVPEIRVTSQAIRDAFVGLDAVDLSVVFSKRAADENHPKFLRGSYRDAMRLPWRKRSIPLRHAELEDGNCSCCSPGCCCSGLPEEVTSQRANWHSGSRISVVDCGQDCWRHQVIVMNTSKETPSQT